MEKAEKNMAIASKSGTIQVRAGVGVGVFIVCSTYNIHIDWKSPSMGCGVHSMSGQTSCF